MQRNQLLRGAHRQPLRHHALSKSLHLRRIGKTQKRTSVSCRNDIRSKPTLHQRRQLHEAQGVGDLGPRPGNPLGKLRMSALEVLQQLLVGRSLLQRIELNTVQVLQQRVTQQIDVVRIPNDRRNRLQPGFFGSAKTPLTHNKLVPKLLSRSSRHLTHHNRLQQTHFCNRGCQFRDVLFIEDLTGLTRVRVDQLHRNLSEAGTRNGNKLIGACIRRLLLGIGLVGRLGSSIGRGRRQVLLGPLLLGIGVPVIGSLRLLLLRFT